MCGRYVRRSDKQRIAEHLRTRGDLAELPMPDEDYNVAPSTAQPIIRQSRETGEREMVGEGGGAGRAIAVLSDTTFALRGWARR